MLAETELSLKKAFEIAQAIETAEKDTKDIVAAQIKAHILLTVYRMLELHVRGTVTVIRDNMLQLPTNSRMSMNLKRHACGKVGHIQKACMSKKHPPTQSSQPAPSRAQHTLKTDKR